MISRRRKINKSIYGGYKKYKKPSIFRASKIRQKKEINLPKIPIKTLLLLIGIMVILYYLFFSGAFKIKDVMVEGNKMVSSDKIESEIPRGSNILFFKLSKTKREILDSNPEINNLEIYRGLPNAIKVIVLEHECKLIWQSGDTSYLISNQGNVAKKIEAGETYEYPRVADKKNIPVEVGSNLVSPSFVAFITNISSQFFTVTNIQPNDFEINQTTFDVNLNTEAGFYVKFNSLRSSAKQLDNLKQVLVVKRDQIHEYVDLRIDGWAYYK